MNVSLVELLCFPFLQKVLRTSDFSKKLDNFWPLCPGLALCAVRKRCSIRHVFPCTSDEPVNRGHVGEASPCAVQNPLLVQHVISERLPLGAVSTVTPVGPHLWTRLHCYTRVDGPLGAVTTITPARTEVKQSLEHRVGQPCTPLWFMRGARFLGVSLN